MKTSYQLYSSRNFGPIDKTLSMVSELGYAQVEGYGALYSELDNIDEFAASLRANDLEMPSAHMGLETIEENPDKVIEICRALGVQHVFVPYLDASDRPADAEGWRAFGERLSRAGQPLIASGHGFGWHNHDFEFKALDDGSMPIDHLFEGAPNLTLEFDLAWCARAGQDPADWLKKLGTRTAAAHVKDIAPLGEKADEDGWADVGAGTVDWTGLMIDLRNSDCALFIVEHDNPNDDRRFASESISYLNSI